MVFATVTSDAFFATANFIDENASSSGRKVALTTTLLRKFLNTSSNVVANL